MPLSAKLQPAAPAPATRNHRWLLSTDQEWEVEPAIEDSEDAGQVVGAQMTQKAISQISGCSFQLRLLLFPTGRLGRFVSGRKPIWIDLSGYMETWAALGERPRVQELLRVLGEYTRHPVPGRRAVWTAVEHGRRVPGNRRL